MNKNDEEIKRLKNELDATNEADGFPGNILERTLAITETMPLILALYSAPTAIVIAFSSLVSLNNITLTCFIEIGLCTALIMFLVLAITIGNKYKLLGAEELVSKPAKKTMFSFSKLFVFLFIVTLVPKLIFKVEIDIDRFKTTMFIFVGIYFADLLLTKLIKYIKNEHFYDPNDDKKAQKILDLLELLICTLSIIGYGLAIFPLTSKEFNYQIVLYFSIILILAVIFTIIDYFIIKKQRKIKEHKEEDNDVEIEVNCSTISGYKVLFHFLFLLMHIVILLMCMIAWKVD